MPTDKIWTVIHAFTNFVCYAYTYNGVGISYTVAREVLSICEQFNVLQEQYPETDLVQLYIVYNKTRCLTTDNDAAFEPLLRRLVKIQCTDVKRLTVQRTYDHPVFGLRCGDITMSELVLDAKITMFDLIGLLAHIFDEEDTQFRAPCTSPPGCLETHYIRSMVQNLSLLDINKNDLMV